MSNHVMKANRRQMTDNNSNKLKWKINDNKKKILKKKLTIFIARLWLNCEDPKNKSI